MGSLSGSWGLDLYRIADLYRRVLRFGMRGWVEGGVSDSLRVSMQDRNHYLRNYSRCSSDCFHLHPSHRFRHCHLCWSRKQSDSQLVAFIRKGLLKFAVADRHRIVDGDRDLLKDPRARHRVDNTWRRSVTRTTRVVEWIVVAGSRNLDVGDPSHGPRIGISKAHPTSFAMSGTD